MTATTTPPRATVVMPVRDEQRHVAASLAAVLAQDLPGGALEILVVDGRSGDRTREIVRGVAARAPFPVRLLDNPGRSAAAALSIGLASARADVIVRVDGHAEIPVDYVRRLLDVLDAWDADAAGGVVRAVGGGRWGEVIASALASPLGHGGAAFRVGGGATRSVDTVAFPAYRRAALERVGGFDETLQRNQDDDLHLRLRRSGGTIVLVPDLVVRYRCREDRAALFRQYRDYGFWKAVGWRRNGVPTSWRAIGPPLVVLVSALTVAPAALLVGLSLVRCRLGALATMHLAYGLGFWHAVARRGAPPEETP